MRALNRGALSVSPLWAVLLSSLAAAGLLWAGPVRVLGAALLGLGCLVACAHQAGGLLLRRTPFGSSSERALFRILLGLGLCSHAVMVLGLCGALHRPLLLALLGLGAAAFLYTARQETGRLGLPRPIWLLLLLPIALLPLYPPIEWDVTEYHLALARGYAEAHRVQVMTWLRYPVFAQLHEMLFTLLCAALPGAAGEVAGQGLQVVLLLLVAAGLVCAGRRFFSERAGLLGAALWLGSPMIIYLSSTAYVDIGLSLFTGSAAFALGAWLLDETPASRPWLALCGALAGFAASSKYTGLFTVLLLGTIVLVCGLRRPDRGAADVIGYGLPALVTGAPWYLYNAWHTGNPVFPFLGSLFGYGLWSAEDLKNQMADLHAHGVGTSLGALLRLPFELTLHWERFQMGAPLSPFYLLCAPALLVRAVAARRVRATAALALAYLLFWFGSAQLLRYLSPLLPILSLATAAAVDQVLSRAAPRLPGLSRAGVALALLFCAPGIGFAAARLVRYGVPPLSAPAREAFTGRHLPAYAAIRALNQRHGRDYRVYGLYTERMAYFVDGVYMGDWFGPARYARVVPVRDDPPRLHAELCGLGATHFLAREDQVSPALSAGPGRLFHLELHEGPYLVLSVDCAAGHPGEGAGTRAAP